MPLEPGWTDKKACVLCGRDEAPLVEYRAVCFACLPRLGRFILDSPRTVIARFWAIKRDGERLGKGSWKPVRREEADAHADMAIAFREMSLPDDALAEAAIVLASDAPRGAARAALDIVLGRRLRYEDVTWIEDLRGALFPV